MKTTSQLHLALLATALLPFAVNAAGPGSNNCGSGSSCIVPQTSGYERPVTNTTQDVLAPGAGVVERVQNKAGSKDCYVSGASECVRPMQGGYAVVPYPTALETVSQPGSGLPAVANWLTTNAVAANMSCGTNTLTLWSGAVSPSGTNVQVPGSDGWAPGTYACTLVAINTLGRQASATSAFTMVAAAPTPPTPPLPPSFPMPFGAPQDAEDFNFGFCGDTYYTWDQPSLTATLIYAGPLFEAGGAKFPTPRATEIKRKYSWNSGTGTWSWVSDVITKTKVITDLPACP